MPTPELYSESEQDECDRASARNALLVGGLSEETIVKVEDRLGVVDWRGLAGVQDSLFMVTQGTLGIRQFWATPEDDGRTPREAMETTDTPDQVALRMNEYANKIELRRFG